MQKRVSDPLKDEPRNRVAPTQIWVSGPPEAESAAPLAKQRPKPAKTTKKKNDARRMVCRIVRLAGGSYRTCLGRYCRSSRSRVVFVFGRFLASLVRLFWIRELPEKKEQLKIKNGAWFAKRAADSASGGPKTHVCVGFRRGISPLRIFGVCLPLPSVGCCPLLQCMW